MDFKSYHVREANVGQPLSAMLRRVCAGKSWSEVKQLVVSRRVQINGNLCTDETRRLKPGEIVRIAEESMEKRPTSSRSRSVTRTSTCSSSKSRPA